MRLARYVETVESDDGDVYDVFTIAVPRDATVNFATLDLTSGTLPSAADSRAVAKPVAAETQAAVADGRLVLP
jgi:hypothetical protein